MSFTCSEVPVMSEARSAVYRVLAEIQEQQGYRPVPLKDEYRVVKDLGFSSMDVAQLIAVLEMELAVDPFSMGVSIMEIHTIGQLCDAYEHALAESDS